MLKKKVKLRKGTEAQDGGSGSQFIVREVGMCLPEPFPIPELLPGQIGYLEAKVPSNTFLTGQTLTENPVGKDIESYGNFKLMKPSVFASFYPQTDKPFSTFRKIWMPYCDFLTDKDVGDKWMLVTLYVCQFLNVGDRISILVTSFWCHCWSPTLMLKDRGC